MQVEASPPPMDPGEPTWALIPNSGRGRPFRATPKAILYPACELVKISWGQLSSGFVETEHMHSVEIQFGGGF